jgi:hypothetical protein
MTSFSFSVNLAWQLSAREASAAWSEFIEPPHILIGICSLEKFSAQDEELSPSARQSLLVILSYRLCAP